MNQTAPAQANRRPEFITLIAIYQFVTAGILFLLSCLIPSVLFPSIFFYVDEAEGVFAAVALATGALALFIGFGFASVVVGWGLLRMREWARLGAIVLGAFALIGFPIWTIVAILVLVYMTSDEAREAFSYSAESAKQGDPRYHDAVAATAAYKTEPAAGTGQSPLDHTRPMGIHGRDLTNGGTVVSSMGEADEVHQIDAIPMPPPTDPAAATEHLYDDESDVSDHYRRWKSSLSQETTETTEMPAVSPESANDGAGEQPTLEIEATETSVPPAEPDTEPKRRWFRPPEEAGMDDRILGPREDDEEPKPGS